jgi:hypothetical protein
MRSDVASDCTLDSPFRPGSAASYATPASLPGLFEEAAPLRWQNVVFNCCSMPVEQIQATQYCIFLG